MYIFIILAFLFYHSNIAEIIIGKEMNLYLSISFSIACWDKMRWKKAHYYLLNDIILLYFNVNEPNVEENVISIHSLKKEIDFSL